MEGASSLYEQVTVSRNIATGGDVWRGSLAPSFPVFSPSFVLVGEYVTCEMRKTKMAGSGLILREGRTGRVRKGQR